MSTHYYGTLDIYGSKNTLLIMKEAERRLAATSGKSRSFNFDDILEVFFGGQDDEARLHIGCRGLVLDDLEEIGERQHQYRIFFSTLGGYPDYFAKYLVNKIAPLDPKVKIKLDCIGDGVYKHKEVITPSV